MEKTDIDVYAKSDLYYLTLIGEYVRANRLNQNKTQQELADAAGVDRTTMVKLEKGKSVNLLSLIQILRSLKKLQIFQELEIKSHLSPIQLAEIEQKQRQRAGRRKETPGKTKSNW
jgi:transcriptional regulator with XRE-family HTH domain